MTTTRFVDGATKSEGAAINELQDQLIQVQQFAYTADTDAGTIAPTVAQFVNGILHITGGTTSTVTTPTATQILAALQNGQIGSAFDFILINGGSGTCDFVAGDGVTFVNETDPTTLKTQHYKGIVTAVSTPAVSIIGLGGLI